MTDNCSQEFIPWSSPEISSDPKSKDAQFASTFMNSAVNDYGCYKAETGHVVAANANGMKGQGWNGAPSSLTCLCPYGMTYDPTSDNRSIYDVIGTNCKDAPKPKNCESNKTKMGQCLDDTTYPAGSLKNLYVSWFWFPNLPESNLHDYIAFQLQTVNHIQASFGSSKPKVGLCVPLSTWPDHNNLTFMSLSGAVGSNGNAANRDIVAKWMIDNFITPATQKGSSTYVDAPGLLAYMSYSDGPWNSFYSEDGSTLQNPINALGITAKQGGGVLDMKSTPISYVAWGCMIDFLINHVAKQLPDGKLPANFWLHLDKEGSHASDKNFTEENYTEAIDKCLGPHIKDYDAQSPRPILFLAAAIQAACPKQPGGKDGCGYTKNQPVIVPEYYWGAGNQLPCDGSEGSYGFANSSCTSMSAHRRLRGHPEAYVKLIEGNDDYRGSDCPGEGKTNGWLGSGNWQAAIKNVQSNPDRVWPSFSIENLSLCDLEEDVDKCYSMYEELRNGGAQNPNGLPYTTWNDNSTTICSSMLFGSMREKGGTTSPLSQGMKSCGVFDGFSHWTWPQFQNFLNYFSQKYSAPNLIIYEASFIPYNWIVSLGLKDTLQGYLGGKIQSALVPYPSGPPNFCPFYNENNKPGAAGCKSADKDSPSPRYCDDSCTVVCTDYKDCSIPCGGDGSKFNPVPGPPAPEPALPQEEDLEERGGVTPC